MSDKPDISSNVPAPASAPITGKATGEVIDSLQNDSAEPVEETSDFSGSDTDGDSDVEHTKESEYSASQDPPDENSVSDKLEKGAASPDFTHSEVAGQLESDESDEEEDGLKKLEAELHRDILLKHHPEIEQQNYGEILALCKLSRDTTGSIVDPLHRTLPFLSKYERARILGLRAKQLNTGSAAFVEIPEGVIDGLIIARLELAQRVIPFIIRRPLPNGQSEYWKLADLEDIYY